MGNKKGSKKEDESKVARPRNSWILYRIDVLAKLQADNGSCNAQIQMGNASRIIAKMWKEESVEVKLMYQRRADEEKEEHKRLYPDYVFKPRTKEQKRKAAAVPRGRPSKKQKKADFYEEEEDEEDASDEDELNSDDEEFAPSTSRRLTRGNARTRAHAAIYEPSASTFHQYQLPAPQGSFLPTSNPPFLPYNTHPVSSNAPSMPFDAMPVPILASVPSLEDFTLPDWDDFVPQTRQAPVQLNNAASSLSTNSLPQYLPGFDDAFNVTPTPPAEHRPRFPTGSIMAEMYNDGVIAPPIPAPSSPIAASALPQNENFVVPQNGSNYWLDFYNRIARADADKPVPPPLVFGSPQPRRRALSQVLNTSPIVAKFDFVADFAERYGN